MHEALLAVYADWKKKQLMRPEESYRALQWKTAAERMTDVWRGYR